MIPSRYYTYRENVLLEKFFCRRRAAAQRSVEDTAEGAGVPPGPCTYTPWQRMRSFRPQ